jgi:hypothetical protein
MYGQELHLTEDDLQKFLDRFHNYYKGNHERGEHPMKSSNKKYETPVSEASTTQP